MRVSEIFYSIQGEGIQIGLPTIFLRLFGCDLRCSWCDTMYAVEGTNFKNIEIERVKEQIYMHDCKRICITGGEPLLQEEELEILAADLIEQGYNIVLETSGHRDPPNIFWNDNCLISMDCKCPSSNMEDRMDFKLFEKLRNTDQLKFIIQDEKDYHYAKKVLNENRISANIIFQPVHDSNMNWLYEKVLNDKLNVRTLPQLHKILWGEGRGV
jgi:7-carboxy-7-deazaguanine synthase